jgi:putative DNA primase/helicase
MAKDYPFLSFFNNHIYRYIDQTGNGRPPVSTATRQDELNVNGYEAYFTVNGFAGQSNAQKDKCTNINAFFVDIDGRKDLEELDRIKKLLEPTFILETKNGHHIYWVLDEALYKEDMTEEEWAKAVTKWEAIEQSIVTTLNTDPVVKDITRIMRIPQTFYWKKSGDAYKNGTEGVFKIKGVHKNHSATYSMDKVAEVFPVKELVVQQQREAKRQSYADAERNDFFAKVNQAFPMHERESFKKLISGVMGTIPAGYGRNQALIVTASLMKQAGWTKEKALEQVSRVGWHGMESEKGGAQEIMNTINSAYHNNYTYSYKHDLIAFNMTTEEEIQMQETFLDILKGRKEKDKVRFSNYENEVLVKYPNLKKNEIGMIFNYHEGVYKMVGDQEVSNMILRELSDDMLWNFRTKKHISDKVACLLSIIPDLKLTDDKGCIMNVKNGLLNIYTREIKPHTPDFISLIQSSVSYDPEALCPMWESCVSAWMEGAESEKKTELLQQFAGYTLTSSMQYDRALFLVGDGGNGKSTFVDTIAMVIGEQATSHIDLEDLYGTFGMHGLIGKRLNVVEEVHGNYYQSNKLKKLVSGEPVTINVKYKDAFFFKPECKFIFAVNIMPRVDDTSTAMERRICAIVFKNNFRSMPNTALRNTGGLLAQELSGIFNWMLDGAKNLHEKGKFTTTTEQSELLREYRQENSSVEGFIAECLDFQEGQTTPARELYEQYKEYCTKDGRKFKGNIGFTKEMKQYGTRYAKFTFHERTNGHSVSEFEGVVPNPDWARNSNVNSYNYLTK